MIGFWFCHCSVHQRRRLGFGILVIVVSMAFPVEAME